MDGWHEPDSVGIGADVRRIRGSARDPPLCVSPGVWCGLLSPTRSSAVRKSRARGG
jgi:hypothetical protein